MGPPPPFGVGVTNAPVGSRVGRWISSNLWFGRCEGLSYELGGARRGSGGLLRLSGCGMILLVVPNDGHLAVCVAELHREALDVQRE